VSPRDSENSAPVPPQVAKDLTVKQQREARRAEKVAALKKQQAKERRNRILGISLASIAGLAIVALVITFVVTSATPKRDAADIAVEGVQTWPDLTAGHVDPTPVDYAAQFGMNPPAGGPHWGAWLNCGVYTQPQENERAVHALEHGALWITYDDAKLSDADVQTLRNELPDSYIILSPYVGLDAPVVASGWGAQVKLDGVDDTRLKDFVEKYWKSADVPEPGARCDGAVDGPGKVA
jgi:hypothetical protein